MDQHFVQRRDFSFFGKGSFLKGVFHLRGDTHISSRIEGDIVMEDKSLLRIEAGGGVLGKIKCHHIEIYGDFDGKIEAAGKIKIFPTASVKGSLIAHELNISSGAQVNIQGHTEDDLSAHSH